jgi:DNA-binding response OmpR family regulator
MPISKEPNPLKVLNCSLSILNDLERIGIQALTRIGFEVTAVEDGVQGWDALHSDDFDLLITDITDNEMPRLNGLDLAVKARREGMTLPIILASASAATLGASDYKWLHFAAWLQKPFAMDELQMTAKQVLEESSTALRAKEHCASEISEQRDCSTPNRHWGINE